MTRPMPPRERRALVDQYRGRRKALAEAAHLHIKFYEDHEGFDIAWQQWTEADARRTVQSPYSQLAPVPQCVCDEDFLVQILWRMVSQDLLEEAP